MVLNLVGIGLGDADDITVKGLNIVKRSDKVFLEAYTSILCGDNNKESLEKAYGREIILADREFVESDNNQIISLAKEENVTLLVVGDPFSATTHSDLILRAKEENIDVHVVHNASIMTAVACCGLQLYSFGETVSIPLWEDTWKPSSFMDKIIANYSRGLHTLCLLDIKVKEKSLEALMKGRNEYEKPRFMSVATAARQLSTILKEFRDLGDDRYAALNENTMLVGLARVGSPTQQIIYCSLKDMQSVESLGPPLHTLVVPSNELHPLEDDLLKHFTKIQI